MARRGPVPGTMRRPSSLARAEAHWGDDIPAWVCNLARECDRQTQSAVATRLGYSASALSQVLGRKYPGDLSAIEQAVRRVFGGETLACPALGEIDDARCAGWRQSAREFSATNPERVRMYFACRNCGRFRR